MNFNVNWDAISAIGTCCAAFATLLACCIALWQTKYTNRKLLKLNFNNNTIVFFNKYHHDFVSIDISNVGNRSVEIREWALYVKNGHRHVFFVNKTPVLPVMLPVQLDVEKSITLYYNKADFMQIIMALYKKHQISRWNKLTFGITDGTGKVFYTKSRYRISCYLNEYKKSLMGC